jgi:hypothetical protein
MRCLLRWRRSTVNAMDIRTQPRVNNVYTGAFNYG